MELLKRNPTALLIKILLLAAIFGIIQFLISSGIMSTYYQMTLTTLCLNIILAVSLNLINGFTGQLSLGHAGFMAIGAYVSVVVTDKMDSPFIVGIFMACLAAALAGLLIGMPTLRLRGDYLAIATLGFGEIIKIILFNISYVGGAAGITGIPKLTNWAWLFAGIVITVLVINNLVNSSYGRAIISIREDEVASELMGINIANYKILAFVIGAMFAGLAGALYAHYFFVIKPNTFGFMKSFDVLVMVVLGGLGSTSGAIIAAIFVTVLSTVLQSFPELRMVFYAIVLIVVMIFRPQGLMGNKELSLKILHRKQEDKK